MIWIHVYYLWDTIWTCPSIVKCARQTMGTRLYNDLLRKICGKVDASQNILGDFSNLSIGIFTFEFNLDKVETDHMIRRFIVRHSCLPM